MASTAPCRQRETPAADGIATPAGRKLAVAAHTCQADTSDSRPERLAAARQPECASMFRTCSFFKPTSNLPLRLIARLAGSAEVAWAKNRFGTARALRTSTSPRKARAGRVTAQLARRHE